MRKLITLFLLVVAVAVHAQSAAQARKVLDKVAAVVGRPGGCSAQFSLSAGKGRSFSGTIAIKGRKFYASTAQGKVWYDGRTQWSYLKSTGEVMGVGRSFEEAFVKSQMAASVKLPESGRVFISVKDSDKDKVIAIARDLHAAGFSLLATRGTAATISKAGIPVVVVNKVTEGRPHIVDMIKNNEIALIINTVEEKRAAINDSRSIRTSGLQARVTIYTTIWGAEAAAEGIRNLGEIVVYPIQELHAELA